MDEEAKGGSEFTYTERYKWVTFYVEWVCEDDFGDAVYHIYAISEAGQLTCGYLLWVDNSIFDCINHFKQRECWLELLNPNKPNMEER